MPKLTSEPARTGPKHPRSRAGLLGRFPCGGGVAGGDRPGSRSGRPPRPIRGRSRLLAARAHPPVDDPGGDCSRPRSGPCGRRECADAWPGAWDGEGSRRAPVYQAHYGRPGRVPGGSEERPGNLQDWARGRRRRAGGEAREGEGPPPPCSSRAANSRWRPRPPPREPARRGSRAGGATAGGPQLGADGEEDPEKDARAHPLIRCERATTLRRCRCPGLSPRTRRVPARRFSPSPSEGCEGRRRIWRSLFCWSSRMRRAATGVGPPPWQPAGAAALTSPPSQLTAPPGSPAGEQVVSASATSWTGAVS